jgi:hypothetical protein
MRELLWWALAATSAPSVVAAAAFSAAGNDIFGPGIHARQANSCGGDLTLSTCGNGRPSNWCCPKTSQCLDLNNVGTQAVICCPAGNNCGTIQTIACDTNLVDASKVINSALHIANLTVALPTCGSQCCPLGFECQTGVNNKPNYCRALDKTFQPQSSSTASSTSSQESATVVPTIGTSPSASADASTAGPVSNGPDGKIIAAVIIPIAIIVLAIMIGLLWFCRKSKSKRKISDPIYDPQMAARTDFLGRRTPQLSLSPRVSPLNGTRMRPGTADSISPLAPNEDKFPMMSAYPPMPRPLPKAPRTQSPDMMGRGRGPAANQPPDQSHYYTVPREVSPMKGTMTAQPAALFTLPNVRYQPPS